MQSATGGNRLPPTGRLHGGFPDMIATAGAMGYQSGRVCSHPGVTAPQGELNLQSISVA